jgi:glycosyltransferase involved in cell wall biosynthesis
MGDVRDFSGIEVAVIVPCYNEAAAVGKVVSELRDSLPTASIYVYDNNSTDDTAAVAAAAGAIVRHVGRKGKGNVVRRAFADVEADVYVLIDGDDTYEAARAAELVRILLSGPYDHVVGVRKHSNVAAYRPGHTLGNRMLTGAVGALFGREITDMLSGYRAFSRRYVKSFPALAQEFEIETELTIHSLHLRVPGIPVVLEFLDTGLVPRFPTAILASSIGLVAILMLVLGYLLDAIGRSRQEAARLTYLRHPAVTAPVQLEPVELAPVELAPVESGQPRQAV